MKTTDQVAWGKVSGKNASKFSFLPFSPVFGVGRGSGRSHSHLPNRSFDSHQENKGSLAAYKATSYLGCDIVDFRVEWCPQMRKSAECHICRCFAVGSTRLLQFQHSALESDCPLNAFLPAHTPQMKTHLLSCFPVPSPSPSVTMALSISCYSLLLRNARADNYL